MGVKLRFRRGAWWIFIDHRGQRRSKRIGDKQTAERLAKEIRERLVRSDFQLPATDASSITLTKYCEDWMRQAKLNLKASTIRFYDGALEQHILPALGSRLVSNLKRSDCRDLVMTCRAKGLKVKTVQGIARTLSTILSQAVEDELLPANPALRPGRYLRSADDPEPAIDPFTADEVELLLSTARTKFPDWYPWLLCGFRTGMRAGELLGLQWGD